MSSLFINTFNIFEVTPLPIKAPATSHSLWRKYCRYLGIKDSIIAGCSLCKYTWEVVICRVLTSKEYLGPDIWPEIYQQAKCMESMMRIMWNTEVMQQQKASGKPDCPLAPMGKEVKHMRAFLFCD